MQSSQKLHTRRYDYVRYSNGKTFGKFDACLQSAKVRLFYEHSNKLEKLMVFFVVIHRPNRGPLGLSNVQIVFVIAMNKANYQIVISLCTTQHQILMKIGKSN